MHAQLLVLDNAGGEIAVPEEKLLELQERNKVYQCTECSNDAGAPIWHTFYDEDEEAIVAEVRGE